MFKLTFSTDNAAFESAEIETARILREVAERIEQGDTSGKVRDINGNTVGEFKLETEE